MALSGSTVWEIRTTGDDTNGGGYVSGGTDWSQQDSPQYSVTDAVTAGTTTITSATANFGTDVVGNLLCISGGTGSITKAWYQIISRTNGTTIVVDRSTGLTAGTGATLKIGGALASIGMATSNHVSGMYYYIKAGTYSITSTSTNVSGGCVSITSNITIIGYSSTRTDGTISNGPLLQASGAISSFTVITIGANGACRFLQVDCASKTTSRAFVGNSSTISFCKALNCTNGAFYQTSANTIFIKCWATGCSTTTCFSAHRTIGCVASGNTIHGFNSWICEYCIAYNNTGAGTDGFTSAGTQPATYCHCIAYGNGRHGFFPGWSCQSLINCIAENNGGWGYTWGSGDHVEVHNCAGYNNTSGNVNTASNLLNKNFVTGSGGSFFTNPGSGDFSLNNIASRGAALRAAGFWGVSPDLLSTAYGDIGAVQHADPSGGAQKSKTVSQALNYSVNW